MRRHLASCAAVVTAVTASLGLAAGAASAATAGHVAAAAGLAAPSAPTAAVSTVPATTATKTSTTKKPPAKKAPTKPKSPARAPVKGTARMYLLDAFFTHHKTLILPGRNLHITGAVRPYVPGQKVTFRAYLGKKLVQKQTLNIKLSPNKRYGRFTTILRAPAGAGILHLSATHKRTKRLMGFQITRGVASLNPQAGFGDTGSFVQLIQAKLAALHFYIPQSGVYDGQTGLAIDAYHRLLGHGTSQSLDSSTVADLLSGTGAFKVRYPQDGRHAEGNLGLQLLALIDHGKVQAIYPISSGKPSTPTILGRFHVYMRTPGYLPDGMYYSNFFTGGYAIHGFDPAPDYPASHGCMRLPISDAISVWDWLAIGDGVDVYY
jgi:lipoprotein-anchoring transpeptidase ErfK/SrfK